MYTKNPNLSGKTFLTIPISHFIGYFLSNFSGIHAQTQTHAHTHTHTRTHAHAHTRTQSSSLSQSDWPDVKRH